MLAREPLAAGRSATECPQTSAAAPHLGQLEGDVAAVTDHPGAMLISFSRKLFSDHGSAVLGIASVRMKLPRL